MTEGIPASGEETAMNDSKLNLVNMAAARAADGRLFVAGRQLEIILDLKGIECLRIRFSKWHQHYPYLFFFLGC